MKILVTGFKPFLGAKVNPSEIHSLKLADEFSEVSSLILPVEFQNSFEKLKSHISDKTYDLVILLGQASDRKLISIEKIALNWIQSEHKDEASQLPATGKILENSELALMTKLDVDPIYKILRKENHPVEISFSAGAFVCNDIYFRALESFSYLPAIFIHVPTEDNLSLDRQYLTLKRFINIILS